MNAQATDDSPPLREYNPLTVEHSLTILHTLQACNYQAYPHLDGVITIVPTAGRTPTYVYALPWSRGWSIFMSASPSEQHFSTASTDLRHPSRVLYAPARTTGPWRVRTTSILSAIVNIADAIKKDADDASHDKRHWYWPRSAALRPTP